jgi:tetratricopeptide (TPR) repeat protein
MMVKGLRWVLVFAAAVAVRAQEPRPMDQTVSAYHDLVQLVLVEHKSLDPEVIARILKDLKAHWQQYPDAFKNAGDFYLAMGKGDLAVREYEEGVAADSAHKIDYQKRMIEALARQGKLAEARAVDLEILKENPQDPEARRIDAAYRLDKGDVDGAIAELEVVLPQIPTNFMVRFHLGGAYFLRGELEKARVQLEESVRLKSDFMPARIALIQLALKRPDYEGALKYAQDALKVDRDNRVATLLEANSLIHLSRWDEARTLLEKILQANPDQPDALYEMAVLNLGQKHYPAADALFQKCYEAEPGNIRGLQGMVQVRLAQNDPDKALQLLADEAAKHPDKPGVRALQAGIYSSLGQAHSSIGDFSSAIANVKKAHEAVPSDIRYANTLAQLYERSGNDKEAIAAYREVLKINPNEPHVLNNLAFLIARTGGDLDEALAMAERSKQQLADSLDVSDTVGWIYLKKNQVDRALEIFRGLVEKAPGSASFRYHYGMALLRKGDKTGASRELNEALRLGLGAEDEKEIRELIRMVF